MLEITNILYHQGKDAVSIDEPQALMLVGEIISLALQQGGFTAEIRLKK